MILRGILHRIVHGVMEQKVVLVSPLLGMWLLLRADYSVPTSELASSLLLRAVPQ